MQYRYNLRQPKNFTVVFAADHGLVPSNFNPEESEVVPPNHIMCGIIDRLSRTVTDLAVKSKNAPLGQIAPSIQMSGEAAW